MARRGRCGEGFNREGYAKSDWKAHPSAGNGGRFWESRKTVGKSWQSGRLGIGRGLPAPGRSKSPFSQRFGGRHRPRRLSRGENAHNPFPGIPGNSQEFRLFPGSPSEPPASSEGVGSNCISRFHPSSEWLSRQITHFQKCVCVSDCFSAFRNEGQLRLLATLGLTTLTAPGRLHQTQLQLPRPSP